MKVKAEITTLKHQEEFAMTQEKYSAIVGGFGSGKSQAVVFRALQALKEREHATVVVIAPTYALLKDINIPDFEAVFEQYCIPYHHMKADRKLIINSGGLKGEIWFRSADNPTRIVGFDATDIIIDEYDILRPDQQRELWRKALGRLRGAENTTISVTTTPEGFKETYELFEKQRIGPLIRAKTTDNIFLPPDFIQSLYDQYDEMLVRQYVNAEFVNINGAMAYYAFSRDRSHRATTAGEVQQYPWIGCGMDFNVAKMCAEFFLLDEAHRKMHYFDEITLKNNADTEKMARVIRERYPNAEIRIFPDATGKRRTTNATESDIAILRKHGFRVYARESNPFVRDRLNAANAKLSDGSVTVDTDRCPDLTEDLEKVMRDKYGEIDKADENLTHSSDAFSYPIAYLYPVRRRVVGAMERGI